VTIWVVVPAYNEAENLPIVMPQILEHLSALDVDGRLLVVDDGSTDGSTAVLDELTAQHPALVVESLRRNRGKAAALNLGFTRAVDEGADVVVMMDADGQDDPAELPRLLERLAAGDDLVTGARADRQDRFVKRTTSRLYNRTTRVLSGVPGTDFNSGFKVMRADVARDLVPMLYGDMHRYITVLAHWLGYRTGEVVVEHHPRLHGVSKYGISRFWRGMMDLITVRFLMSYEHRPSHLFGGVGLLTFLLGAGILGYLLVLRLMGEAIGDRPALIAGVLLVVVGLQLGLFGLLAELTVFGRQRDRAELGPRLLTRDGSASGARDRVADSHDRSSPGR
jgi:glycosyltransferase involved in cell wall biosynthesis